MVEVRLKDGLQDQQDCCLDNSVAKNRDAQRPLPAVGLVDVDTLHGVWSIGPGHQRTLELFEERSNAARSIDDVLAANTVDTRALVFRQRDLPGRREYVESGDSVVERVESEFRLLFGLLV